METMREIVTEALEGTGWDTDWWLAVQKANELRQEENTRSLAREVMAGITAPDRMSDEEIWWTVSLLAWEVVDDVDWVDETNDLDAGEERNKRARTIVELWAQKNS